MSPPAGDAWDLNCDKFEDVHKWSSHFRASSYRARAPIFGPRFSGTGSYCPLLKTERLTLYLFLSVRRSHHRTRPAYPHGSIHQWRRARPAVRLVRWPPPRTGHECQADHSPFLRITAERAERVASL